MICGDQCLKIFGFGESKELSPPGVRKEEIRRCEIQIEHSHLTKMKNDIHSTSDIGSESDSGLGSVRTSKKQNQTISAQNSEVDTEENGQEAPESTICTVTRADSMGTLAQDCISLDQLEDEFISVFDGAQTLTDLVMAEFQKLDTIDVQQLQADFEKYERAGCNVLPLNRRSTRIKMNKVPKLNVAQDSDTTVSCHKSETNARPSREKKMRKKRKTKKKVQDEGVSETDSSEDGMNQNIKPSPQKRKSLSKEEKPVPSSIQA
jgi:hypothetical protein